MESIRRPFAPSRSHLDSCSFYINSLCSHRHHLPLQPFTASIPARFTSHHFPVPFSYPSDLQRGFFHPSSLPDFFFKYPHPHLRSSPFSNIKSSLVYVERVVGLHTIITIYPSNPPTPSIHQIHNHPSDSFFLS